MGTDSEKAYRLLRKLTEGQDTPDQKSAVDRYQSAFLMPKWLLQEAAQRYDLTRWRDLYALAEVARVNISNLTTRLLRLGMIFIPKGEKTIYQSKDEFTEQGPGRDRGVSAEPANGEGAVHTDQVQAVKRHD